MARSTFDWERIRAEYEATFAEEAAKVDSVKRGAAVAYVRDELIAAVRAFFRGFRAHLAAMLAYHMPPPPPSKPREIGRPGRKWAGKASRHLLLRINTGGMLRRYLKGPSEERDRKMLERMGYGIQELRDRLLKTMPTGCTWDDFIQGDLHIDHIVPDSVHNYTERHHEDFRRAWSLSNLQLLTRDENIRKSDWLDGPFQPSLAF